MGNSFFHTKDLIDDLKSNGKYTFRSEELTDVLTKSQKNINKDLDRLKRKGEIYNVRRGFYIIIPDHYKNMGILPVELFADDLMKHVGSKYYAGLFSAAMLHGAAHQQPQEFYIIHESPNLRNVNKDKMIINFIERRNFPDYGIEEKKTETGFLRISGKEMTFFDLIYYERLVGGLNRIITVLFELAEEMKTGMLRKVLKNKYPVSVCQRAGHLLDHVIGRHELSGPIYEYLKTRNHRSTLLNPSGDNSGEIDQKWRVQVNIQLESEV